VSKKLSAKLLAKSKINQIFAIFSEQNPHPKTELKFLDNFTLLIAVVLSAQSTDIAVNKATAELYKIAKTPQEILELGEEGLKKYIAKIGLFNSKAANIIKLCKRLIADFNSEVPNDFDSLKSLPGVGQKTANVVLNCAFGRTTIAVDTHVFRVANRLGIVQEKTPEKCESALLAKIPQKWQQHAHHWLILHGRYVCIARKPKCDSCKISQFCRF
jgi:endonuclease-3